MRRIKEMAALFSPWQRPQSMDAVLSRLHVETLLTQLVAWLPSLFVAIVLLVLFWLLFRLTRNALSGVLTRAGFDRALVAMLVSVYRFSLSVFALIMAAGQLGINVGAALAGLGVVGLTIGFAAKDSLGNIMAGFLIFWDKPFRDGDWVTLDNHYGQVATITMRTTRLRTRNNTWIIVPNEAVINRVLINHSTNGKLRLEVPVGIAYKESIAKARHVILERVCRTVAILTDPAPAVIVKSLGDSSVNLSVQAWIENPENEKPVYCQIVEAVKLALDEAHIEIPFPHLQLFVDSVRDDVWQGVRSVSHKDPAPASLPESAH